MTVLLLNASMEPLRFISMKRAVVLVLQEKAEILEEEPDRRVRAATISLPAPKVIALTRFVQIPFKARIPLSNRAVLKRDNHTCGYCGRHAATVDHIVPRSRGGKHEWNNVVACCRKDNGVKADKLLSELGWELKITPYTPRGTQWLLIGIAPTSVDPAWEPYLAI